MSELLRYVDAGLQNKDREGDARNPGDEANDGEDGEEEKDDSARPVFPREHVDGGCEAEEDVENALEKYKLDSFAWTNNRERAMHTVIQINCFVNFLATHIYA
jgi:hypothetical protein